MLSVEDRKNEYLKGRLKEELKTVVDDIEKELEKVPFKSHSCEIPLYYEIENPKAVSDFLVSLGYDFVVIRPYKEGKTVVVLHWDTSTDDDIYYITNGTHPSGNFMVDKMNLDNTWYGKRHLMEAKHWGNYFKSREEAQEVCKQLNHLLREHVVSKEQLNKTRDTADGKLEKKNETTDEWELYDDPVE